VGGSTRFRGHSGFSRTTGKTSAVASARPRKSRSSFTAMSPEDVAALETWIRGATSERWNAPIHLDGSSPERNRLDALDEVRDQRGDLGPQRTRQVVAHAVDHH